MLGISNILDFGMGKGAPNLVLHQGLVMQCQEAMGCGRVLCPPPKIEIPSSCPQSQSLHMEITDKSCSLSQKGIKLG